MKPDLHSALSLITDSRVVVGKPIYRTFIIGGASLYAETLSMSKTQHSPNQYIVDRILLTRIMSPSFEHCDVFFPDFQNQGDGSRWQRASHKELQQWVEYPVPEGLQEENGIEYEFQMWTRDV